MGVVIRQSIKGTIWNYLGVLFGAANIMWVFPYFLSPEEIGIYRVVLDLGSLFALFAGLASNHIADRFYVRTEESKRLGFVGFMFFVGITGFIAFSILYCFFGDWFFELFAHNAEVVSSYKGFVLLLTFAFLLLNLLESMYRVRMDIVTSVFFREVFLRVVVLVATLAIGIKLLSFDGMMDAVMYSYVFTVIALTVWYYYLFVRNSSFSFYWPDKSTFKDIASYGAMILIAGGSSILISRIDVLMIAIMMDKGLDQVAVYSLGFFIASIIEIPRRSISQIATPLIANAWHHNDVDYIDNMYKRSAMNQLIIGGGIFMLIWISIDDLIAIIPQHELYMQCKVVFLWIGISRLVNMAVGLGGEIILQSKYYMFNIVSLAVLVVLVAGFNYLFIPVMGIEGAAIGALLALLGYNLLKVTFIQVKLKMTPFSWQMVYVVLVGALCYIPFLFWPAASGGWIYSFIHIALKSLVYLILVFPILYKMKVSEEMNKLTDRSWSMLLSVIKKS